MQYDILEEVQAKESQRSYPLTGLRRKFGEGNADESVSLSLCVDLSRGKAAIWRLE